MSVQKLVIVSAFFAFGLAACGPKKGDDGADAVATRIVVEDIDQGSFECAYNGKKIKVFKDANGDGKLSKGEEIVKERTIDCPTLDR